MVEKLLPDINKVYFINSYTLIHILSGNGSIEVDFKNYTDWEDKAIYLEKGQYIKFLSDDFVVRKIEFPNEALFRNKEIRVLFKHLISLGYIDFKQCEDCKKYLETSIFSDNLTEIIDVSSKQWYWQNPFNASKSEYQIIFDVKEMIDESYNNHLSNADMARLFKNNGHNAQALVKNKIGLSVRSMLVNKRITESKKAIAFTDKSIKEVSYDLGYKDPAYFQRVFKNITGTNPAQFRKDFDYPNRDTFAQNLLELLNEHHRQERSIGFYANKMHLSVKTLSKKTKDKLNVSLGQLIRGEVIATAKSLLCQHASIKETSWLLGFDEAHHFTHFFKKYVGVTPSDYQSKKCNS